MKSLTIKIDDTIVALGTTVTKDGISDYHKELCTVVDVGKRDIFARTNSGRIFKIPASRCIQVKDVNCDLNAETLLPKLGDLVLCISERYTKIEKKVGVLVEITDIPGRMKMGTILQGETKEVVSYESLIVLE